MPSFNQADYLGPAIESILNQGYPDLELIVMDGGSQDHSVEILQSYGSDISFWKSEADRGQSDALNKAFKRVTGDIVGWLNSDDCYEPGTFEAVTRVFSDERVQIAMSSQFGMIDKNGVCFETKENGYVDHQTLIRYWATNGMTINQPCVFFRAALISNYDEVLDTNLDYAMDYDLWLRMTLKNDVQLVDGRWANYRFHDSSKSGLSFRSFVPEWYSVSQRFWGKKYSPGWLRFWLDHFYQWNIRRPIRIIFSRLSGNANGK